MCINWEKNKVRNRSRVIEMLNKGEKLEQEAGSKGAKRRKN